MRYLFLFIVLLAAGCSNNKQPRIEPAGDSLSYHTDSVKIYAKNPVSPDSSYPDTAKATVLYPVFADQKINILLEQRIAGTIDADKKYTGYRDIAQSFINEFEEQRSGNTGHNFMSFMQIGLRVAFNSPEVISVLNTYFSYQGGAHPNTVYLSYNIDPRSYTFLTIDSLLKPGGRARLDTIAESIFRKQEGLSPAQSLAGNYFFENDRFKLPQTFVVTKQGIRFTYSPYEIKPYAAGKTELLVPFSLAGGIIREKYLIKE